MASTSKRKADAPAGAPAGKKAAGGELVNPARWQALNDAPVGAGPVIYWCARRRAALRAAPPRVRHHAFRCRRRRATSSPPRLPHPPRMSRDQRMRDNWALLHALEVARANGAPAAVAFNLVRRRTGLGLRAHAPAPVCPWPMYALPRDV